MKICLSVDKTGLILLLFASFLLIVSSSNAELVTHLRRRRYEVFRDGTGAKTCATDAPFQTFSRIRSRVACSAKCAQLSNCERFNFNKQRKTCDTFVTNPSNFATVQNCEHYQLIGVSAPMCSFPFTLNGELYHQCTALNDDWREYDEVGCFATNHEWVNCLNPKDFVANPKADNLTIRDAGGYLKTISVLSIHNWIVILQRIDDSLSFNRNWTDYKNGFGNFTGVSSNFWLGNERLYLMTNDEDYKLRVEFQFRETGDWYSAEYDSFWIDGEASGYMLHVSGFWGDINDSFTGSVDGMKFSTPEADNDSNPIRNCAEEYFCGWWMNQCFTVNLNGLYESGIRWDLENDDLNIMSSGGTIREVRMMVNINDYGDSYGPDDHGDHYGHGKHHKKDKDDN